MPWLKVRWWLSGRVMSSRSGSAKRSGSRFGRGEEGDHSLARLDEHVAHLRGLRGGAPGEVHRAVVAEDLFDRAGRQRRVLDEPVPLVALAQQGDGAVADQVGGGLVAGHEEEHDGGSQLLLGELVALLLGGEQRGEEVVAAGWRGAPRRCR